MNKLATNRAVLEESAEAKQARKMGDVVETAVAEGALLRRLLIAKDPDQKWGDLQRIYYKPERHHLRGYSFSVQLPQRHSDTARTQAWAR